MKKINYKKFKFFVILLCIFCVNISVVAYCSSTDSNELSKTLEQSEIEEISDYKDLQEMIGQIFEIDVNLGTDDLSDPIQLMYSLVGRILVYWDNDFTSSSLYYLLVGLALVFLVANFSVQIYEESSTGMDTSINSKLMIKKYIQFIFAILLIYNIKGIVYFILAFFRFVLKLSINVTEANFISTPENLDVLNSERISYEILKQNGIIKSNTLLDEVIIRSKESSVRTQYMIPWVLSWISKLALLVVVFINSIKLFVYCAFYVVAVGDFLGDIKNSKFIEYTKILLALVLEEAVIVIILYMSNLLLNPYLRELLKSGIINHGISFLTLSMIFTGVSMSKFFVIISSSAVAKRIVGVA